MSNMNDVVAVNSMIAETSRKTLITLGLFFPLNSRRSLILASPNSFLSRRKAFRNSINFCLALAQCVLYDQVHRQRP